MLGRLQNLLVSGEGDDSLHASTFFSLNSRGVEFNALELAEVKSSPGRKATGEIYRRAQNAEESTWD